MGQALYRKYRSKSLSEVVGQDHIATTLTSALKSGKISHAYLLTGPKGVGKTSVARILAHEINGLPYDDEAHMDIIEIDAASNNSVEDVRDLREKVMSAPASAKYKVYIIDEVHMLSKAAFNALLKTLEEPPEHVVFILATTEVHKLPETIISRTQRYSFRPVPLQEVMGHLRFLAKQEKLAIDDDALQLIAEHGEGSFRDSISLLDQASNMSDHITLTDIENLLGRAPQSFIDGIIQAIDTHDPAAVTAQLQEALQQGYDPALLASQLSGVLRQGLLKGERPQADTTLDLLRSLLDVAPARQPAQLLELTLLSAALANVPTPSVDKAANSPTPAASTPPPAAVVVPPATPTPTAKTTEPTPAPKPTPRTRAANGDEQKAWQQVLETIKSSHNTLYGVARMAVPTLEDDTLTLAFKFAFHQKRMHEPKNRKLVTDVVAQAYGRPLQVECIVQIVPAVADKQPDDSLQSISNIFGGAELLD